MKGYFDKDAFTIFIPINGNIQMRSERLIWFVIPDKSPWAINASH